jgi:hypothetical protein
MRHASVLARMELKIHNVKTFTLSIRECSRSFRGKLTKLLLLMCHPLSRMKRQRRAMTIYSSEFAMNALANPLDAFVMFTFHDYFRNFLSLCLACRCQPAYGIERERERASKNFII